MVPSHAQSPEEDSDSDSLTLWDRSNGGGEAARAGLSAARGCGASRSKCFLPARRLGTAPRRSRDAGGNHFPTRVPIRSPPFRARASPRLRHRAHGVWTDQLLSSHRFADGHAEIANREFSATFALSRRCWQSPLPRPRVIRARSADFIASPKCREICQTGWRSGSNSN